jgi:putative transposase
LHLHSQTVQAIAEEYATRRRQFRKVRLSWRKSTGSRRSLGWIPFKKAAIQAAHGEVGIDLGLEDLVATSDGEKVSAPQFYRGLEPKLAIAQRAGKKNRVRAIHAKMANRRKDSLHQFSTRLVRAYDTIFVGNVNASALVKTPYVKSVLDAGWSAYRTMLRYKCDFAGATFAEVTSNCLTDEALAAELDPCG